MGSHEHSSASVAKANRATAQRKSAAKPAASEPTLTLSHVVRVDRNVRSSADRRQRVDYHILSYHDSEGHEYRKSVETAPGVAPRILRQGTSAELEANKTQHTSAATARTHRAQKTAEQRAAEWQKMAERGALERQRMEAERAAYLAQAEAERAAEAAKTPEQRAADAAAARQRAAAFMAQLNGAMDGSTERAAEASAAASKITAPEQAPKASGRANGKASAKVISGNKDYPQLNGLPQSISGNKVYNELVKGSYIRASIVAGFPPEPMEVTMRVARTGMRSASNDVPLLIEGPNNFHVRQDWETNQIKRPSEFPEWTKSFTYIGKVNPQTGELIGKGSGKGARSAGAGARAATAAQSKASKAAYDQLRGVINPSVFGRVMKLSIYRDATARVQRLVGDIESLYRAGSLDHNMDRAAYALSHAVVTGRANSDVSRYIKSATGAQLLQLVADINARVIVPQNGDMTSVGRYLNYTYRYDDQGKRLPALKGWEQPGS